MARKLTIVEIAEFEKNISKYLAQARKGKCIAVTKAGYFVARLVKVERYPIDGELATAVAEGILKPARHRHRRCDFEPIPCKGKPASQMIIEDREERDRVLAGGK